MGGFDLGEFINNIIDHTLESDTVYSIAKNPLYTGVVIVLILMLIILIVFRDVDSDESVVIMTFRSGFWMLLAITGVLLLHNKVLTNRIKGDKMKGEFEEVFKPVQMDPTQYVPIPPTFSGAGRVSMTGNLQQPQIQQPQIQQPQMSRHQVNTIMQPHIANY